jgi:hypothetical protein
VAVAHDDGFRVHITDRQPRRVVGAHPEVEQERIVDQDRTPTDLTRAAEKPDLHYRGDERERFSGVGFPAVGAFSTASIIITQVNHGVSPADGQESLLLIMLNLECTVLV